MRYFRFAAAAAAAMVLLGASPAARGQAKKPVVALDTNLGAIHIEMEPEKAPATVKNFLDYVKAKHYDGLVFHRVIPEFMIQGGGMDPKLQERKTKDPIKNEADNGLKNKRGSIAMARTPNPDSATSQFFINVKDNEFLDHRDATSQGFGYAVFGQVIKGMDVVDKIVEVKTKDQGPYEHVPVEPVIIKTAKVLEPQSEK